MAADPMGSAVTTPTAAAADLVRAAAAEVLERYRILANTGLTVGMELVARTVLEEFLLVAADGAVKVALDDDNDDDVVVVTLPFAFLFFPLLSRLGAVDVLRLINSKLPISLPVADSLM